jgi:hypothetical protein
MATLREEWLHYRANILHSRRSTPCIHVLRSALPAVHAVNCATSKPIAKSIKAQRFFVQTLFLNLTQFIYRAKSSESAMFSFSSGWVWKLGE